MPDPALVHFVRDVLGCGCPNEVLQSITVERGRLVPAIDSEISRMDVGGRLLVYVVGAAAADDAADVLLPALAAGVGDRDRHGFNRFRLVLATPSPKAIEPGARSAFDSLALPDDRVHLHIVADGETPMWRFEF